MQEVCAHKGRYLWSLQGGIGCPGTEAIDNYKHPKVGDDNRP